MRDQLRKIISTDTDLNAFLIDYFKIEVFDKIASGAADRVAIENMLFTRVEPDRIGDALADWVERHELQLHFSLYTHEGGRSNEPQHVLPPDLLLDRVLHACRIAEREHRECGLKLRRLTPRGVGLRIMEVSYREGSFVTRYGLGITDQPVTIALIKEFLGALQRYGLLGAYARRPQLIYSAPPPTRRVREAAERRHIVVRSLDDYELLLNIQPAVSAQTNRLWASTHYPVHLYVPQRGHLSSGSSFRFEPEVQDIAAELLQKLLAEDESQFVLILGEFGLGKTFLMYELARRLGQGNKPPWPVLCELRNLDKRQTLDSLLAAHMQQTGIRPIDPEAFRHLMRLGKIFLFFDGFDELALRTTYERATEHLETLLSAIEGQAKVVLTSRTQHFLNDQQIKTALGQKLERVPTLIVNLLPFKDTQIRQFLRNQLGEAEAERRYQLIHDIHDLLGLSENPRMLGFIAALEESRLLKIRELRGHISAAELYRLIIDQWLDFEVKRAQASGRSLSRQQLLTATTHLALVLWLRSERSASLDELEQKTSTALSHIGTGVSGRNLANQGMLSAAEATYQVGAGSLLVRDAEGRFSFLHLSVLEWLVAAQAAAEIHHGQDAAALSSGEMSRLMADFFIDLLGKNSHGDLLAARWAAEHLDAEIPESEVESDWGKRNALRVAERLKEAAPALTGRRLAGQDLAGQNFSTRDLSLTDLSNASLRDASLIGVRMRHADLRGADLRGADLQRADLRGADLRGADLSRANLAYADLRQAKLEGAILRRVKFLGARLDSGALEQTGPEAMWGSVKPHAVAPQPVLVPRISGYSTAFNPDGDILAVACGWRIGLWDVHTGKVVRELSGHLSSIWSIAWSPDGKLLASGAYDSTIRLWETQSGKLLRELAGHQASVWSVAWSPDGKLLASSAHDNTVKIWDPADEDPVQQWAAPSAGVAGAGERGQAPRVTASQGAGIQSVSWSPNGQVVTGGAYNGTVYLFDSASGKILTELVGHQHAVSSVAWASDGNLLASGSMDGTVRIWDAQRGELRFELIGSWGKTLSVAWSPNAKMLASGAIDGSVRIWNAQNGTLLHELACNNGSIYSIAWSCDNKLLASSGSGGSVRLWDAQTGLPVRDLVGQRKQVLSAAWSIDDRALVVGLSDGTLWLWDTLSCEAHRKLHAHQGCVWTVAWCDDGENIVTGGDDGVVRLWDGRSFAMLDELMKHRGSVRVVEWSRDAQLLASGGIDGLVKIWNARSREESRKFLGHGGRIWSIAWSVDSKKLAAADDNGVIWLLDMQSNEVFQRLVGNSEAILSIAWSQDNKILATALRNGTVLLWDTQTGKGLQQLAGPKGLILSAAWSEYGQILAAGSTDGSVRFWNAKTDYPLRELAGHSGAVSVVRWSRNGQMLASGAEDGSIRLWDTKTGQCHALLCSGDNGWVAFTPDGRYKSDGDPRELFSHVIQLCRFDIAYGTEMGNAGEPGELDKFFAGLRLPPGSSLTGLPPWAPDSG